jgi:hypothetical protein
MDRNPRERIDKEDADYLLQVDFQEYLDFLVEEMLWEPLSWTESQMTFDPFVDLFMPSPSDCIGAGAMEEGANQTLTLTCSAAHLARGQ